jgi:hypothetical protein
VRDVTDSVRKDFEDAASPISDEINDTAREINKGIK